MDDFELEEIQQPGFGRFAEECLKTYNQEISIPILQAWWMTYVFHFPIGTDMLLREVLAHNYTVLLDDCDIDSLILQVWRKLIQNSAEEVLAHPKVEDLLENLIDFTLPEFDIIPIESFVSSLIQCHLSITSLKCIVEWEAWDACNCFPVLMSYPLQCVQNIEIPNLRQLFKYHLKSVNMWDDLFEDLKDKDDDPTLADPEYISNKCYNIYKQEIEDLKQIEEEIFPLLEPSLIDDINKYLQLYFQFLKNHFTPALRKLVDQTATDCASVHFKYINKAQNPSEEDCDNIDAQLRQAAEVGLRPLVTQLLNLAKAKDLLGLEGVKFPVLKAELEAIGIKFEGRKGFSQQNYSVILNSFFKSTDERPIG